MSFMLREKSEGGTNSLRGGKNTYSVKTKVGNWVEHEYKPGEPGKGFSSAHFKTNTQDQQTNGLGLNVPRFGAGLPPAESERMDYGNVVCPYKKESDKQWGSMAKTVHTRPDRAEWNEFSTTFRLKGGMTDKDDLNTQRARWIHDNSQIKADRFATESELAASQSAPSRYHTRQIRRLPGLPLAVERVRAALMELAQGQARPGQRCGVVGALRQQLISMDASGDGRLSLRELQQGLQTHGVSLSAIDIEQVMQYFDKDESGFVDAAELVAGVRGDFPSNRLALATEVFELLAAGGSIPVEEMLGRLVASSHPDVLAGKASPADIIQDYIEQWDMYQKNGLVQLDDFLEYYWDLSAMIDVDEEFETLLRSQWDIKTARK